MAQTGEMTFWDHLEELRGSLFRMLAVYVAALVTLFFFKGFIFDNIILAPSKPDFFMYQELSGHLDVHQSHREICSKQLIHKEIRLGRCQDYVVKDKSFKEE